MTKRNHTRTAGVAPAALRRQIGGGGEIDYDALLTWWERDCPQWLHAAGVSPITAAVLSVLPEGVARDMPGRLRFTVQAN